jgi:hypothetical protein
MQTRGQILVNGHGQSSLHCSARACLKVVIYNRTKISPWVRQQEGCRNTLLGIIKTRLKLSRLSVTCFLRHPIRQCLLSLFLEAIGICQTLKEEPEQQCSLVV